MKTLIRIDRNSIKKNPEAGNTETIIHTSKEIFIKGRGTPPEILNPDNFYLVEKDYDSNEWKGVLIQNHLLDELHALKNISIEIKYNHQRMTHAPLPRYLFEYENSRIICECCGNEFMSNDFKSGVDDEDENYCETICPLCDGWNYDIEYEKFSDAVLAAGAVAPPCQ